ncbi:hypothetical protein ES703_60513 [subsurface metagenome]
MNGVTLKGYAKFVAYVICGLAMITIACIVIFRIFPAPSGSKGYDAALAIAVTVMFWVIAGGIAWGFIWLIKRLWRRGKHKP